MSTPIGPDNLADEVVKYAPRWVREGAAKPSQAVLMAPEPASHDNEAPWHGASPFDEGAIETEDAVEPDDAGDSDVVEHIPGSELLTPIEGPFKTAAEVSFALIAALAFALALDDTLTKIGAADDALTTTFVDTAPISDDSSEAVTSGLHVTSTQYVVAGFNSATSLQAASLETPVARLMVEPVPAPQVETPRVETVQMIVQPQVPQTQEISVQSERVLDPDEVDQLVNRGAALLAQGDVAAARLFLRRAAEARDPRAILMLGTTYDPQVLNKLGVVGIRSDAQQAQAWYAQAAGLGSSEARQRLAGLVVRTR